MVGELNTATFTTSNGVSSLKCLSFPFPYNLLTLYNASSHHPGATLECIVITSAVYVCQNTAGSSDLSGDLKL